MARVVEAGTGVRHSFIFEVRYEQGELFWDRCGRVARTLAAHKGWALQSIDLNGCRIWNEDKNLIFTYSSTKLHLTQLLNRDVLDLMPPGEFAAIAEVFSDAVIHALEVDYFPRIGFRLLTLYGTESVEDASERISRMSFFSPCKALLDLGALSFVSPSVVVARSSCMVRVAAAPFEQQVSLSPSVMADAREESHRYKKDQHKVLIQKIRAQKAIKAYPSLGMMIDLDAYIEDAPYLEQVSARTFIEEAMSDFSVISTAILEEKEEQ
jgi:hypothetical protein